MTTMTKEGQMEALKLMLSRNLVLRLFENDIKPDYYNTIDDYKEVSGGGYSPKVLNSSKWKFGFVADIPTAGYPDQLFVFVGPVGIGTQGRSDSSSSSMSRIKFSVPIIYPYMP